MFKSPINVLCNGFKVLLAGRSDVYCDNRDFCLFLIVLYIRYNTPISFSFYAIAKWMFGIFFCTVLCECIAHE